MTFQRAQLQAREDRCRLTRTDAGAYRVNLLARFGGTAASAYVTNDLHDALAVARQFRNGSRQASTR